jgi:hypothetical protein
MYVQKIFGVLAVSIAAGCQPHQDLTRDDAEIIPWEQAVTLIQNDEVASLAQGHDKSVLLFLADGRRMVTATPQMDLVLHIPRNCNPTCREMIVYME